jgi:uncharacterized protein (TIGR03437 family)
MTQRETWLIAFCLLPAVAPVGLAQKPVINPGGIVNAATFQPLGKPGYGINPGSLASVFGLNLASTTAQADTFPLPTSLAGTSVTINGIPAPLIFVSPTQINLQVPWETVTYSPTFPIVVRTAAGASDPVEAEVGFVPGIFTLDGSGCGRGAVLNVASDGSVSLNSPDNSVEPGGILTLFGTGWAGLPYPPLSDGMPAPANPPSRYYAGLTFPVLRGDWYDVYGNAVLFLGAAPGYAGLDQINLRLPDDAPEACSVPLQLWSQSSSALTPAIPVSVHRGGGRCVDPHPDSVAVLRWTKAFATGVSPAPATDVLSIEFASAIGQQGPFLPAPDSYRAHAVVSTDPLCPGFSSQPLDAGAMTARAGVLPPVPISRKLVNGLAEYSASVPTGYITPPTALNIAASGALYVGPFTTTITIPEPIQLTTNFPPGTILDRNQGVLVRWTGGGDPNSVVTVRLSDGQFYKESSFLAETGGGYWEPPAGLTFNSGPFEIIITQTPNPATVQRFQARGLTLGGWHLWSYVFRFAGLQLQ